MIAFLVTMPISIRMPITTGMLMALPVSNNADRAADRKRQRQQDRHRLEDSCGTAGPVRPAPAAGRRPWRKRSWRSFGHGFHIAAFLNPHAGRQMPASGRDVDLLICLSQRHVAGQVRADQRPALRSKRSMEEGPGQNDIGNRTQRNHCSGCTGYGQCLRARRSCFAAVLEFDTDRNLPVARVEFGEAGPVSPMVATRPVSDMASVEMPGRAASSRRGRIRGPPAGSGRAPRRHSRNHARVAWQDRAPRPPYQGRADHCSSTAP